MKIAVGISGGVDSGVAAWKLKQEGHDIFGMFMINWHDTEGTLSGDCPWEDDLMYAKLTCRKLGIPLEVVDLSKEYKSRIADYMFAEYEAGRTPNPDVLCNREIKWDVFAEKAFALGADKVATGHYCRVTHNQEGTRLFRGKDSRKDQSYFLCQTTSDQLSRALFPIGEMEKDKVRELAKTHNLAPHDRKDSQGLCFIGKIDLPTFLKQKLAAEEGDVIEIPRDVAASIKRKHRSDADDDFSKVAAAYSIKPSMGHILGKHQGAHFYTIGQRKGIGIGGTPLPLFVISTDIKNNILYVGQGGDHPLLGKNIIELDKKSLNIISPDFAFNKNYDGVIRYRQQPSDMQLIDKDHRIYAAFDKDQIGVASGQFCAWYDGDELIGSAVIS